ncbi:Uncharacterised protein [Burkholderia pseudomallei]|nr:Uncharacterised protein [Burkholderia pseudomallei]CAJ8047240.1 Uncharacterised protein [Burkholderia pseudomallei]
MQLQHEWHVLKYKPVGSDARVAYQIEQGVDQTGTSAGQTETRANCAKVLTWETADKNVHARQSLHLDYVPVKRRARKMFFENPIGVVINLAEKLCREPGFVKPKLEPPNARENASESQPR